MRLSLSARSLGIIDSGLAVALLEVLAQFTQALFCLSYPDYIFFTFYSYHLYFLISIIDVFFLFVIENFFYIYYK